VRTFLRLLGFLRPYRAGVVASLVLATFALAATVAIPWLTGQAVDKIDSGDRSGLERLIVVIVLVALVRVAFSVARRLVAGQVSLGVEYDLRNGLYGHLMEL
jgi:ABC-type multidrug transport system fused ATPase/permease subunit